MSDELNKDEEELLNFAREYNKFLNRNPKIRFNLHETVREISQKFEFIEGNL